MSVESVLDDAFTTLLDKARTRIPEAATNPALPTVIVINFDGGGQPLVAGLAGLVEVTFPCTILGCHMFAGTANALDGIQPVAATASVDLRLGSQGAWAGGSVPIYSGTMPTLTAAAEANISVTSWRVNLQPGDLVPYWLASISGPATWLTVTLPLRRLDVREIGSSSLTDSAPVAFTDTAGTAFVIRG